MFNDVQLDFSSLRHALTSLEESLSVVQDHVWFEAQTNKVQKTLMAGVIQNFEFFYELSFKMLKRQMILEAASSMAIDEASFRDVIRLAAEKGLIGNVEAWFEYRKMRNLTSHTYDEDKAHRVYQSAISFFQDARHLLTQLERRHA